MIKIDLGFCKIEQKSKDTLYILLMPDVDLNGSDLHSLYDKLKEIPERSSKYLVLFTAPGSFIMGGDRVLAVSMFTSIGYAGIAVVMESLARKISTTYFRVELAANDTIAWFDNTKAATNWIAEQREKAKKRKRKI
jgi:hypothetical protein